MSIPEPTLKTLEKIGAIVREAGAIIMPFYRTQLEVVHKDDKTPLTQADLAANAYIMEELRALAPGVCIVSEEEERPEGFDPRKPFFLVDPLDGTKSFVRGEGAFTVNIGLIVNYFPVVGAIYIPTEKMLYLGHETLGAFRQEEGGALEKIEARKAPAEGLTAIVSSQHGSPETDAFVRRYPIATKISASSSVKFCRVAEGMADVYPRIGRTMEWDTAAGQAIVEAAGGGVETPEGARFSYGKPDFANGNFVVWGKR